MYNLKNPTWTKIPVTKHKIKTFFPYMISYFEVDMNKEAPINYND